MTPVDLKQISVLLDKKLDEKLEEKLNEKFRENNTILHNRLFNSLIKEIKRAIDDSEANIIAVVDKHKADKDEVKEIEIRVEKLEQTIFS
ncbi:MAG: hypothetical protein COU26_02115 [Candidatus Levybacteria bacterium CG10_big_fil_rev_8_21_14_0_10_36_30]|nr:MAG: hypothetical protein COU26_02115 [Candidatus Levybacteria bacterium CG10_big_fil_rev_8_21_14_0_10_36_30]